MCGEDMGEALRLWASAGATPCEQRRPRSLPPAALPESGDPHLDSAALMLQSANALLRGAVSAEPSSDALATLARLPSVVPDQDVPDQQECHVCLLPMRAGETLVTLPCFHLYHRDCIQRWLTVQRTCPVCKHDPASCAEPAPNT